MWGPENIQARDKKSTTTPLIMEWSRWQIRINIAIMMCIIYSLSLYSTFGFMLEQFIRIFSARSIESIFRIGNFAAGIITFIVKTIFRIFHNLVFGTKRYFFLIELNMVLCTPLLFLSRRLPFTLAIALILIWQTIVGLILAKLGYLCINELQQALAQFLPGAGGMEGGWNPQPDPSGGNSIIPTIALGEGEPSLAPAESNSSTWYGSWVQRWFNPSEGASAEVTSQLREVPDQAQPPIVDSGEVTGAEPASSSLTIEEEILLERIAERKRELKTHLDRLFREELLRQTGRRPPDDFQISNLDEQVDVVIQMYSHKKRATLKLEHRSLSCLLSQLESQDVVLRLIQVRVKLAIENAVRNSINEGLIHPEEW